MKPLVEYQNDPIRFVREVLGCEPWAKQEVALLLLRDHPRVTVRACHGIGKTFVAACAALRRLHCFEPSTVLTTAPTHRQVKEVLWREIRRLQKRARLPLPGEVRETAIKISDDRFALGLATDETDRFQGFHSEHLFVVVEEASGVDEAIFDAIDGCLTTAGARLLLIGNPLRPTGRFADSHRRPGWAKLSISAWDCPNVDGCCVSIGEGPKLSTPARMLARGAENTQRYAEEERREQADLGSNSVPSLRTSAALCASSEAGVESFSSLQWPEMLYPRLMAPSWVLQKREEWGEESPIYQSRVLGQFPEAADDSLISLTWIESAIARRSLATESTEGHRERREPSTPSLWPSVAKAPREAGIDIARYGGCETVVVIRCGDAVERVVAWMGSDLMATTGRIVALLRECGEVGSVKIDAIGMGAGVFDRLRELGVPGIVAVNVGLPAKDRERFANRRDEGFFALRDRFRSGAIALPKDELLSSQLATLRYSYSSRGQLKVESKDDMRARGVSSPDRADALMLAFLPGERTTLPFVSAGPTREGIGGLKT